MTVEIDPIAFYIPLPFFGWWPIYWYGISWLVAILSINYVARLNAPTNGTINTVSYTHLTLPTMMSV